MTRKKWILVSLFAAILLPILLLVVALVYLNTADLSQHRDYIARQVSKVAGRRLSLNGEFDLNLSLTPSVVITDITLANAAWGSKPEMLTIQRVEAEIALLPLIHGDIHIPRFHFQGVKSLVETDSDGLSNWVLTESTDTVVAAGDTGKRREPKLPWFGDLLINDFEFAHHDGQTGKRVTARIDHARVSAAEPDSPTTIDVVGEVNNNPVEINGKLALPKSLARDSAAIPIELHVKALGLNAHATGTLSGAARAPAIDLSLRANADNLNQLRQVFGAVVPQVSPVSLVMEAKGDPGQPVKFKVNATAGEGHLDTVLTLRRDKPRPHIKGNVEIRDVDVARLWARHFAQQVGNTKAKKAPVSAATSSQDFNQPINLVWLADFDANVLLAAKRINLPYTHIKSLQSRFIVDERVLKIVDTNLVTDAGSLVAELLVDAQGKQPAVRLELKTTPLALAALQPLADNERFTHSHAEATASLTAQGDSVTRLIDTLQGSVQLDYENSHRKEQLSINLQRQPAEKKASIARLHLSADGHIDGQPIELRGSIDPPSGLLIRNKPYAIDLTLQAYGVSGKINGTTADPYSLKGLDLVIEAHAADQEGLRRAFGQGVPKIGKTSISTRFKRQQSKLQLSDLQVGLGDGKIDGWLVVDTSAPIPDLQAELIISDLNLETLLPAEEKPAKPQKKSVDDKLFSSAPLPFEKLSRANVKATLRANNVVRNNKRLKEAEIKIDLVKSKLSAELLKLSAVRGELVGDIVIDASGKGVPTVMLKLKAPHVELGELLGSSGGTAAIEGPLATDIFLLGQGTSLAQIMGTLNGNINLLMQQGSADARALEVITGGLRAIFGTMFVDRSSKSRINCAICDLQLKDGMLTPRLAILDTEYSTVFTEGYVDLKKEQLNIKVSPQGKRGVALNLAVPVRVRGTLSKPDVQVQKTAALLKAGELWATILYPPTALLKFSELSGDKQNPCISMVAKREAIPMVSDVDKAVDNAVEDVGDAIKDVGGAVKDVGAGIGKFFGTGKKDTDTKTPAESDTKDVKESDVD